MRTASLLISALSLTAVVGCAGTSGDVEDELAGESTADGDGKADDNGTYTYYDLRSDLRRCASPFCGGVFVDRVNRSTTACTGGEGGPVWDQACYAADIDWSESGLSEEQIGQVMSAAAQAEPGRVLVRGYLRSHDWGYDLGEHGRLFVTEAWIAQTAVEPIGVFVKVKDSGLRCFTTPCESNAELKLNSSLSSAIAGIDFAPSGAGDDVVAKASEAIATGNSIIIAGYRYTIYENGQRAKGREAYQVYLRLMPGGDAPCYVGGCSGQVCSDQDGVITTCEWQEEYACYADATCARQGDGTCGWTPTAELEACLGASAP